MAYLVIIDDEVIAQFETLEDAEASIGEFNAMQAPGDPLAGLDEDCDN